MILQALNAYYHRLADDLGSDVPQEGTSMENISFALVLSGDGMLVDVEDLREQGKNKNRPRKINVPAPVKRSSGVKANFLWDSTGYILGKDDKGKPERLEKCKQAFIEQVQKYCVDSADSGLVAVLSFLVKGQGAEFTDRGDWPDISGTNLVFRLDGVPGFIHDRPAARLAWQSCCSDAESAIIGQCLVEGTEGPLARLHPSVKGVQGGQSSGASLVAFNKKSFESYGKKQSFNAPVGQKATFAYTTALNTLLARESRHKVKIGDMTLLFWAERPSPAEDFFADLFDPPQKEEEQPAQVNDEGTAGKIRDMLLAIRKGGQIVDVIPDLNQEINFYLLGISPNAARLSIRLWETESLGNLMSRIGQHFTDINIVRQFSNEPEFPPLWRLLVQTATLGKSENVSPVLAGGLARSMLAGTFYPHNLLPVVLDRIRTEGAVTYFRAALLKGYLIRNKKMEVSMSLNTERTDLAYLLGRLFAVLEKAQEEAIPNTGATIKDRYLASASATPSQIFHMLLKNAAHHIAKLRKDPEKKKWAFGYEKKIQEIMDKFDDFPKTMIAEEQGLFMIGYYHQRKDFFTKKTEEK